MNRLSTGRQEDCYKVTQEHRYPDAGVPFSVLSKEFPGNCLRQQAITEVHSAQDRRIGPLSL